MSSGGQKTDVYFQCYCISHQPLFQWFWHQLTPKFPVTTLPVNVAPFNTNTYSDSSMNQHPLFHGFCIKHQLTPTFAWILDLAKINTHNSCDSCISQHINFHRMKQKSTHKLPVILASVNIHTLSVSGTSQQPHVFTWLWHKSTSTLPEILESIITQTSSDCEIKQHQYFQWFCHQSTFTLKVFLAPVNNHTSSDCGSNQHPHSLWF